MKKRTIQMTATLALFSLLLAAVVCGSSACSQKSADCVINGREFSFVDDKAKQEWKEPLARLLANVREDDEYTLFGDPLESQDSSLPPNYACGLLDVTMDGVPELLVYPYGYFGSSGTTTYFIYDIYSGQRLGDINGGNAESWCVYYDMESDGLRMCGRYWLRGGWAWRERYITEAVYDVSAKECRALERFCVTQEIAGEQVDIEDKDPNDGSYEATWVETYPSTTYYLDGQEAYLDRYYSAFYRFTMAHVRIPETELIMLSWMDVADDGDDKETRGRKMAEALITTDQKFVKPLS